MCYILKGEVGFRGVPDHVNFPYLGRASDFDIDLTL